MSKPKSELVIYGKDGKEVCRLDANATQVYKFTLVNSIRGDKEYHLKFIYEYDKDLKMQKRDSVRGVILQ